MHGSINRALQDLVSSRFGVTSWTTIRSRARVDVEVFIRGSNYPDEITHDLLRAASEVLNLTTDELLEQFGEFWITQTAARNYGAMLDALGNSVPELLMALPSFHSRVKLIYPSLNPPTFRCTNLGENSMRLQYFSKQNGMTPFVIGLIKGIGRRFGVEVGVSHSSKRRESSGFDEFLIHWTGEGK